MKGGRAVRQMRRYCAGFITAILFSTAASVSIADVEDMTLSLTPPRMNVKSRGKTFKAHITDPDGDLSAVAPGVTMRFHNTYFSEIARELDGDLLTITFDRQKIAAAVAHIADGEAVTLTVAGILGDAGGGTGPEVLYDSAGAYPDGIVIDGYTWIGLDPVDFSLAEYLNVGEVSGSAIIYMNVEVGGETAIYHIGVDGYQGAMSYPLPSGVTSGGIEIVGMSDGPATIEGVSLTDIPSDYGAGQGPAGDAFQLDDRIVVINK